MDREKIESLIRAWVVECLCNSPIAQHTDAWNHLQGAIPALVDALAPVNEPQTADPASQDGEEHPHE
jgi:hypothetical protein